MRALEENGNVERVVVSPPAWKGKNRSQTVFLDDELTEHKSKNNSVPVCRGKRKGNDFGSPVVKRPCRQETHILLLGSSAIMLDQRSLQRQLPWAMALRLLVVTNTV